MSPETGSSTSDSSGGACLSSAVTGCYPLKVFAAMAGAHCSLRVGKVAWTEFIDDLELKKAISVSPKDV